MEMEGKVSSLWKHQEPGHLSTQASTTGKNHRRTDPNHVTEQPGARR